VTALVSSVYGGYDHVHDLPDDHGFDDAVLVTDRPTAARGWRVLVLPSGLHPRRAAKAAKCRPWWFTEEPASLWLDGAFEVGPGLRQAVDEHLADADLVAWAHPSGRTDAYQEARFCFDIPKYRGEPLAGQIAAYEQAGLPRGSGLWEVGMLARRHTPAIRGHGHRWAAEIERWSIQDQVSFPYACWALGVPVSTWRSGSRWACGWVRWHPHRDET